MGRQFPARDAFGTKLQLLIVTDIPLYRYRLVIYGNERKEKENTDIEMKYLYPLLFIALLICSCKSEKASTEDTADTKVVEQQFNADSAYNYIVAQCGFGARTPGSEAHRLCGDYIVKKFTDLGMQVTEQKANLTMWDGKTYECRNIIASYLPDASQRIIIASHWDSRPWADADKDASKHGVAVMAANDGASGVAVMMETARQIKELGIKYGIDFICFDLEDYGTPEDEEGPADGSDWCVGSAYWASHLHRENYRADCGILLDMVGGKGAKFRYEGFSMQNAQTVVAQIWGAAKTAGYADFFPEEQGGHINDDHLNLIKIGIPTADIISYYDGIPSFGPTWHTTNDTPENISKETLKAVGQTLFQALAQ